MGSSSNLEQRLAEHNRGKSVYTRKGIPWELKYFEEFPDKAIAYKRERYIKALKSRTFIEELIKGK